MIMWAVKSPFGEYYFSIKNRRADSIDSFIGIGFDELTRKIMFGDKSNRNAEWRKWKRKGYKCVKVKIEEYVDG